MQSLMISSLLHNMVLLIRHRLLFSCLCIIMAMVSIESWNSLISKKSCKVVWLCFLWITLSIEMLNWQEELGFVIYKILVFITPQQKYSSTASHCISSFYHTCIGLKLQTYTRSLTYIYTFTFSFYIGFSDQATYWIHVFQCYVNFDIS